MKIGRTALSVTLALALVACGGGGGTTQAPIAGGPTPTPTPSPTPTPTTSACSLSEQQDFADAVLDEWYLFPNLLDNSVNPAAFSDLQSYLNARVAPAGSRDRGFTFATSIQAENDLINSGSSAGFGIRLVYDTSANRVFIAEAYENANGFAAGLDRSSELLAIGTNSTNIQTVSSLMASGGPAAVIDALGPSTAGTARVLRFTRASDGAVIEQSVTKSDFSLDPLSDRYGALVIDDSGRKVGYINLRTFIVSDAANQLRAAFQQFGSQGITELVIDFRYNGGGLVSVADTFGDLMGAGRIGQVWSETVLRPSKSSENSTEFFENEVNAIQPTKIAFIGRGGTASASELVINSMIPYLDPANIALVGANTFGKPVGQFGFDLSACDLRIRAVTFKTNNADGDGEYFDGLAGVIPNTCRANDDIFTPLGDPGEQSLARALDFLNGVSCTPITGGADDIAGADASQRAPASIEADMVLLQPDRPNPAQYEIPGLF